MPALDGGRAGARRGFLRHFPSYRGPLSHGGRGEPEGTEFILPVRGLALRALRFSVPSVVKRS